MVLAAPASLPVVVVVVSLLLPGKGSFLRKKRGSRTEEPQFLISYAADPPFPGSERPKHPSCSPEA